jgi:urease accessory protein
MEGHLELLAESDANGRTVLRRQSFAAPIHISKPHHDSGWLVVNLASPTPGLFAGDRVDVRVTVERGARLLLTAPSASRIHTMGEGHAELLQHFRVASGACLDVWPEYLIPQAGARYRQRTRIEIEPGGTLLWTETIAPGRAARGEAFAYSELRLAMDVSHGTQAIVRERYRLIPGEAAVASLRRRFSQAYYASVWCVGDLERVGEFDFEKAGAGHDPKRVWMGGSRLNASALTLKVVAADSPTLRETVAAARAELQQWLGVKAPAVRRVTGAPAE